MKVFLLSRVKKVKRKSNTIECFTKTKDKTCVTAATWNAADSKVMGYASNFPATDVPQSVGNVTPQWNNAAFFLSEHVDKNGSVHLHTYSTFWHRNIKFHIFTEDAGGWS